jgi:hypothetical protein
VDTRLVASFGHRIYLGAPVLAAAPAAAAGSCRCPGRIVARGGGGHRPVTGRPAEGRPANPVTGALTSARIAAAARMFRRHLAAYGAAAEAEHLDSRSLSA